MVIAIETNAQVKHNLSIGPIVGFGHSGDNRDYGGYLKKGFKPLVNGGGRLLLGTGAHFGIGFDATFRTEGVKAKVSDDRTFFPFYKEFSIHTNYVRLDPKIYYVFGKYNNAIRPKIGIGSSFGFLTNAKMYALSYVGRDTINSKINSTSDFRSFDFGLSGSIGFNYRLKSTTWLNVDAVYNHGIVDITKNITTSPQNRSIFLNAGVTFGIGHAGKK